MAQALPSPQAAADKLVQRLTDSTTYIKAGVMGVTESPMVKAAAKVDKWYAGLTAAKNNGTWQNNLQAVTLDTWKNNFISKGLNRIADGATAAKPKIVKFYTQFFPVLQSARQMVNGMPDDTYTERKARANAYMDAIHAFKFNPAA